MENTDNNLLLFQPQEEEIFTILHAVRDSNILRLTYEMGIFSFIEGNSGKTFEEICIQYKLKQRAAQALLSMCLSLKFLALKDGNYILTQLTKDFLIPESPYYWGNLIHGMLVTPSLISYDTFKKVIFSDDAAMYGDNSVFEKHEADAEAAKFFTKCMHNKSAYSSCFWPKVIDLNDTTTFLDIGGGSGAHSIGAASFWSHLQPIIYDRPFVCEIANKYIISSGLQNRIKTYIGDMWEDPFPSADAHFYSDIFHDWPIDKCQFLANKSYGALPKGGKILIHEMLFNNEKNGPHSVSTYNLIMLLCSEGQQLSRIEAFEILDSAGFKDITFTNTGLGAWCLVTGTK